MEGNILFLIFATEQGLFVELWLVKNERYENSFVQNW